MMTEETQSFDALEWIDRYFAGEAKIDYEQLRPVLCFSLIWNLFETIACRRSATLASIRQSVDKADQSGKLQRAKYLGYVEYFQSRYLQGGSIEQAFSNLIMTDQASQVLVARVLLGEAKDLNNIVYALLLIAHRVRNNLFHGNKTVESLHRQTELFHTVNHLLSDYIEDIQPLRAVSCVEFVVKDGGIVSVLTDSNPVLR